MIPGNAEPIGHVSPYPRIELSQLRRTASAAMIKPPGLTAIEEIHRRAEADRIWRLVVQAAETS